MTATLAKSPAKTDGTAPSSGRSRRRLRVRWPLVAFLAPWAVGVVLFLLYPLAATIYFSLTNYNGLSQADFVGLRNFVFMFSADPIVMTAIVNTAWLVVVVTVLRVLFSIGIASLLTKIRHGSGLLRTLVYMPALAPPVAATLTFVFLLNPGTGPVNTILHWLGVNGPLWFNDPNLAKPSLTLLTLWCSGDLIIIMLAAMLDVPKDLYEAAQLDGANAWAQFRRITIPSIAPVITFGVINSIIFGLQFFTQAIVAGSVASGQAELVGDSRIIGYPSNSTLTFPMWLYQTGFHDYQMGYASAMAVVLFVVSFAFTAILIRQLRGGRAEEAVS